MTVACVRADCAFHELRGTSTNTKPSTSIRTCHTRDPNRVDTGLKLQETRSTRNVTEFKNSSSPRLSEGLSHGTDNSHSESLTLTANETSVITRRKRPNTRTASEQQVCGEPSWTLVMRSFQVCSGRPKCSVTEPVRERAVLHRYCCGGRLPALAVAEAGSVGWLVLLGWPSWSCPHCPPAAPKFLEPSRAEPKCSAHAPYSSEPDRGAESDVHRGPSHSDGLLAGLLPSTGRWLSRPGSVFWLVLARLTLAGWQAGRQAHSLARRRLTWWILRAERFHSAPPFSLRSPNSVQPMRDPANATLALGGRRTINITRFRISPRPVR